MRLYSAPGLVGTPWTDIRLTILVEPSLSRLDSLKKHGIEWVKDIGKKNVEDLYAVIQWNEDNVRLF